MILLIKLEIQSFDVGVSRLYWHADCMTSTGLQTGIDDSTPFNNNTNLTQFHQDVAGKCETAVETEHGITLAPSDSRWICGQELHAL